MAFALEPQRVATTIRSYATNSFWLYLFQITKSFSLKDTNTDFFMFYALKKGF